jgi:hypothetical protein
MDALPTTETQMVQQRSHLTVPTNGTMLFDSVEFRPLRGAWRLVTTERARKLIKTQPIKAKPVQSPALQTGSRRRCIGGSALLGMCYGPAPFGSLALTP